jgi:predicted nuclease of restriction endonuclease-like (RecB) superfamily
MTLGKGFCFIGNQYRLEIEGKEFFVDLLFFNRHLKCLVAFEGVATYRTTKEMPRQMRGILPDVNEIAKLL